MTEEEKTALRDRILDRSVEVEVRIEQLREATQPISPDKGLGRLTRLEAMQDKSVNEAALQRLLDESTRLHNALMNIMQPDFGNCQNCGQAISIERLQAVPTSSLCMECA
ncbi:MAG: TraR/DksA family transcriptional regulator [Verrucomicrobiaceae bacterium]|nr:TraR/DksA family transcriptional regulator [Verrucomicrobiaceae bacterium]